MIATPKFQCSYNGKRKWLVELCNLVPGDAIVLEVINYYLAICDRTFLFVYQLA